MESTRAARLFVLFNIQVKEFLRDPGTVFLSFVFPFIFVVSFIVQSLAEPVVKFKIGIIDESANVQAVAFVNALTATPSVEAISMSRAQGLSDVKDGKVNAVVVIPAGDFQRGEKAMGLIVGDRYKPISDVIMQATIARLTATEGGGRPHFDIISPGGKVRSEFAFVFPGILSIALLQMGLFATAVPMLQARERGTLRYLSLTPLNFYEFLAAQIAFRYVIAFLQIGLLLLAATFTLKLGVLVWLGVFATSCLGVLLMVSIGYLIAGLSPSLQVGMAIVAVSEFGMIFGGNVFWDTSTSKGLFYAAHLVPLSYLSDLFRQVISGMSGLWPIWVDVLVICGWILASLFVVSRKFSFDTPMGGAGSSSTRRLGSAN
jgi:ABC-2 type transport system permease protein